MESSVDVADLLRQLDYTFADPQLLQQALSHPSYTNEQPLCGDSYERLEFVGDAVIGLLVGAELFAQRPAASEGELSLQRAALVRRESLAQMAQQLGLENYLLVGVSQRNSGSMQNVRLLADSFEALVGAVFLDGGFAAARRVFLPRFALHPQGDGSSKDPKTLLQEACHRLGLPPPIYQIVGVMGPDHDRTYACAVEVGKTLRGRGEARSKRAAQQLCAEGILQAVGLQSV
jgi:ribonuclease-3